MARQLDEQVATQHFPVLGATLTVFAGDHAIVLLSSLRAFSGLKNEVHLLSKHLDEEVAKLHFLAFGTKLNVPTQVQADFLGVELEGPFQV